jgi:hypothetical protein
VLIVLVAMARWWSGGLCVCVSLLCLARKNRFAVFVKETIGNKRHMIKPPKEPVKDNWLY